MRLEARDLAVVHGAFRLEVPALALEAASILAVVGPNGAGKTTLLRALAGLEGGAGGTLAIGGSAPVPAGRAPLAWRRRIVLVPQDPALFERTVLANAALGLRLRGVGRRDADARALAWLERLGAAHLAARRPRGLSGGESRRVALARALACEPDVLLLDEPFAALDPPAREALLPDVRRLVREGGVACAFVTHDRDEAAALGDRLLVLERGRIVQEGPPDEVLRRPATPGAAAFLGVANRLAGRVSAASAGEVEVALEGGGPALVAAAELPVGAEVVACLRAEDVVVEQPAPAPAAGLLAAPRSSARNRLPGRVTQLSPEGPLVRVSIEVDGPTALVALITRRSAEDLALAPGAPVVVAWKATAVHLLRR